MKGVNVGLAFGSYFVAAVSFVKLDGPWSWAGIAALVVYANVTRPR